MEMNKMRCHPSVIIENIGVAGWIIIFGLIQQISSIDDLKKTLEEVKHGGTVVLIGSIVIVAVILLLVGFQVNRWAKTYISVANNAIVLERNTMFKKVNTIGIKNISNINIEQNVFHRIVGTYRVKIDTNSRTTANKTDLKIILSKRKALAFKAIVQNKMDLLKKDVAVEDMREEDFSTPQDFTEDFDVKRVSYDTSQILKHCLLTVPLNSLIATVVIVIAVIIALVGGGVGGIPMKEVLLGFTGGSLAFVLFIVTIGTDGIRRYFRFYGFKVTRFKDRIAIEQGLLNHKRFEIPITKINAIKIVEPTISRLFGMRSVELVNIGMGNEKNESAQLFLASNKKDANRLLEQLLPEFVSTAEERVKRQPKPVLILLSVRFLLAAVTVAIAEGFWHYIYMRRFAIDSMSFVQPLVGGVILFIGVFFVLLEIMSYITMGYYNGEDFVAIAYGHFQKTTNVIRYGKVQTITIRQGPLQRKLGVSSTIVKLLAESASSIVVSGMYYNEEYEKLQQKMITHYSKD